MPLQLSKTIYMLVRTIKNLILRCLGLNWTCASWIECHFKCFVHIDSRFFNLRCLIYWKTNITTDDLKRAVCICRKALLVQTCKIIYILKIQHQAKASARIEEQLPKKTLSIFERKGFSTEPEGGKIVSFQIISTKHSFQSCLPMRVLEIIAAIWIMPRLITKQN